MDITSRRLPAAHQKYLARRGNLGNLDNVFNNNKHVTRGKQHGVHFGVHLENGIESYAADTSFFSFCDTNERAAYSQVNNIPSRPLMPNSYKTTSGGYPC
jgi:hypothetical protein